MQRFICTMYMMLIIPVAVNAQSRTEDVFDAWTAVCQQASANSPRNCFIGQLIMNEDGGPLAELRLYTAKSEDGEYENNFQIRVPLGVMLQEGIVISVDQTPITRAEYIVCTELRIAEAILSSEDVTTVAQGFLMQLAVNHIGTEGGIVIPSDLTGFTAARNYITD